MCAADICIAYDGRADEVNVASLAVQIDIALWGNPLDLSGIVARCIAVVQSNLTLYHCVLLGHLQFLSWEDVLLVHRGFSEPSFLP